MQVSFPDPTAPKVGGVPQSHNLFHLHSSNHATVLAMSDTFNIGDVTTIADRIAVCVPPLHLTS
jgi:hypothetical protein